MKTLELNNLPVLTWNHLKVNHAAVDDAGELFGPDFDPEQDTLLPGRRLSRGEAEELVSSAPRIPAESAQAGKIPEYGASGSPFFPTGLGADYDRLLKEKGVLPVLTEIPAGRSDTPVIRRKAFGEGELFLDDGILVVGEGAKAEVITLLAGKAPSMPCGRFSRADLTLRSFPTISRIGGHGFLTKTSLRLRRSEGLQWRLIASGRISFQV